MSSISSRYDGAWSDGTSTTGFSLVAMAGTVAARSAGRGLDALEEVLDRLEEAVGRLEVRRVAAALEQHPFAVRDALVDHPDHVGADLVELAGDQQQRDVDLAEAVD